MHRPKVRPLDFELFTTWSHPLNRHLPPLKKLQEWFTTEFALRLSRSQPPTQSSRICFCALVARHVSSHTSAYDFENVPKTRSAFGQMMRKIFSTEVVDEVLWKLYQEGEFFGHDQVEMRFIVHRPLGMWITHLTEKMLETVYVADRSKTTGLVPKSARQDMANFTPGKEHLANPEVRFTSSGPLHGERRGHDVQAAPASDQHTNVNLDQTEQAPLPGDRNVHNQPLSSTQGSPDRPLPSRQSSGDRLLLPGQGLSDEPLASQHGSQDHLLPPVQEPVPDPSSPLPEDPSQQILRDAQQESSALANPAAPRNEPATQDLGSSLQQPQQEHDPQPVKPCWYRRLRPRAQQGQPPQIVSRGIVAPQVQPRGNVMHRFGRWIAERTRPQLVGIPGSLFPRNVAQDPVSTDPHQVGSSQNISGGSEPPPKNAPNASTGFDSASADVSRPPTRRGPDQSATNRSFPNSTSNELVQDSVLGAISSLAQVDDSSIQGEEDFTVGSRRHSA
ncbi:hypothetical protein HBI73_061710 [Parastagonospora nodorum]|nr:hypothetical protein HBH52_141470 [Parastagonospora nodorum]KAH4160218.1 hypothetical protein HBH43_176660 [Parastagonospora nodorum]KAH4263062.1 hypothetical protein HBI03_106200 [Parastagonospora nodorum]KAH4275313.1 hypothetical protein HBI04_132010 [Parastagonospora nodorum]KAH4602614.1 hypothetical protein HBH82_156930 [Parastagonospora nodorum]